MNHLNPGLNQSGKEASHSTMWPDDWYVFEDGVINGPLQASETFARSSSTATGSPRLVSRRGFTQWYPIKDLCELYKISETETFSASTEGQQYTQQVQQDIEKMLALNSRAEASQTAKETKQHQAMVQKKILATSQRTSSVAPSPQQTKTIPLNTAQSVRSTTVAATPASKPITAAHTHASPSSTLSHNTANSLSNNSMMHHYFILRGRLRLGHIRSTWLVPTLGYIATLGFITPVWMLDLKREIHFHRHPNARTNHGFVWLSLIPLLHILAFSKLAKEVQAMEGDNNYRKTHTWVTALLALVPPFAMMYLQGRVNHHWQLHIRHELGSATQQ